MSFFPAFARCLLLVLDEVAVGGERIRADWINHI